jgi:aspartate/methionine/tyrosine aminotransferase
MIDLPVFRLEAFFSKWDPLLKYNIAQSDAETMTVAEILALGTDEDRAAFQDLRLGYPLGWGADGLREAVASTYERVDWEHVLCFSGAEEAIFWSMEELLEPGDHAIVTVPNYQSMESVAIATGAEVTGVMLDRDNEWALDLDDVRAALRANTKLIGVNFPNNPTGAVIDEATWRALVELCEERGILLFSDEVYRGLEVEGSRPLPQAADLSPRALSLNVMSKAYGLSGLRIGWLACRDHALLERLERRKHYTTICNAGPSEFLSTIVLKSADKVRARNQAIIAENLPPFRELFVDRWGELFEWKRPQGGCVSFPRYLGKEGAEQFCRTLLEQEGVCLLPPSIYVSALCEVPSDHFRIGVGHRDPGPALEVLDRFLRRTPSASVNRI